MTEQELLIQLHQYTEYELYNKNNFQQGRLSHGDKQWIEREIENFSDGSCLHHHNLQQVGETMFAFSTYKEREQNQQILIIQHDRYTKPLRHNHDYYEMLYVYEGEFQQEIDEQEFTMHTGDVCLIPPGVYHSLRVDNYSIVLNILIQKETFCEIFQNTLTGNHVLSAFFMEHTYSPHVNDYILFHTNGDIRIQRVIISMCLELLNEERYYEELLHTNLLMLFGYLLRDYEQTSEMPTIRRKEDVTGYAILKYIGEHLDTITLTKLADKYHYSLHQISDRIKLLTGKSFTGYVLDLRMKRAGELLMRTNWKIKQISEESGFRSQEHFLRTFRTYYQMTPSQYRSHMIQSGLTSSGLGK